MKITSTDLYKEIHDFHTKVYNQSLEKADELIKKYKDGLSVMTIVANALMSAFINFLIACKIPNNQLAKYAYDYADGCIDAALNGYDKHTMN